MTSCARLSCRPVPVKVTRCHCGGCHQTFSGVSAFDKHQTFSEGGGITCHDLAVRGLVLREQAGFLVWGWPERGDGTWRDGLEHAPGGAERAAAALAGTG